MPSTLTNATAVAAGLYHSLALRSNGMVTAWGNTFYNQTVVPASATNVSAIAAGWYHNLAVRSNGTVVAWGAGTSQSSSPQFGQSIVPANLTNVTAIAAGGYHSLALRANGTVVAWGWNAFGQTNVPAGLSNVVAIAAGGSNSIALKNDGTLVAWGANGFGQTNIPVGLSNVVAIAAGAAHNMALKNDRTLVVWGLNGNGQTNVPSGLTNIATISAGGYHSMAMIIVSGGTPPSITTAPTSFSAIMNANAAFAVSATGTPPLVYQWQFNGTNIASQTNTTLTLLNVQPINSGTYGVMITNSYGSIFTNAMLFVQPFSLNTGSTNVMMTTTGFQLQLDGILTANPVIILESTDLVNWLPIYTNQPTTGSIQFLDFNATNLPTRFYRAQE